MQRFRLISIFLLTGGLFLQTSCGYTQKTALPRNIQAIHVDTFKHKISPGSIYAFEPGLEIKITNAIIRRLHRDGNLRVTSREEADVILEGDLIAFDQEGVRFTGLERIEEYRLYIAVALRLIDRRTREVLWEEPNFSGDASYFVTGPRAVSRSSAAEKAVDRLARNVVDRIVEDW